MADESVSRELTPWTEREYPEPTPQPCSDCPWRRNATPGWLGPHSAIEWVAIAHGDSPIACHQTITEANDDGEGDWDHPALRQCRGAAMFREHVCKMPRNPNIVTGPADRERVFSNNEEFLEHHTGRPWSVAESIDAMIRVQLPLRGER